MTRRSLPLAATSLSRRAALVGGAGLLGLGAAACSGASGSGDDGDAITIGYMPSWTDTTVMAFLLKHQLEQRSEEHTSELQSRGHLVCRLLLEKKKNVGLINRARVH